MQLGKLLQLQGINRCLAIINLSFMRPETNWIPFCFNQWLKYARKMRKYPDFKPKRRKEYQLHFNCKKGRS